MMMIRNRSKSLARAYLNSREPPNLNFLYKVKSIISRILVVCLVPEHSITLQRIKQLETLVLSMAVWNNPWIAQEIEEQSKHFDYACLTEFFSESYVDNSYIDRWNALNGSNGEVTGSDDVGFGGGGRAAKEANNRVKNSTPGSSHKKRGGASSQDFREFVQRHKCEHCGKKGHFAYRCPLLDTEQRDVYHKKHLEAKRTRACGQLELVEEAPIVLKEKVEREEESFADPELETLNEDLRYLPVFAEYKAVPFVGWLEDTWIFYLCVVIFLYFIEYMQ